MLEFSDSLNRRHGPRTHRHTLALREHPIPLLLEGVAGGRGSDIYITAVLFHQSLAEATSQ